MTRTPQDAQPAETLADLLGCVAADPVKSAQLPTIFGQFCHDFRNLLNSLRMSLYLARKAQGPNLEVDWGAVETRYSAVEKCIDRFHLICRPMRLNPVRLSLGVLFDDRIRSWGRLLEARGRRLIVVAPDESPEGDYDPMRLASGLDDLVAWRTIAGARETDLRVRWSIDAQVFRVDWDEPRAHEPRGPDDDCRETTPASSSEADLLAVLTLPFLTRIIASHGGTVQSSGPDGDHWRLSLRWPLDVRPILRETSSCVASPPCR